MEKKLKRKEYFVKICQIISLAGVGFKVQIYEVDSSNDTCAPEGIFLFANFEEEYRLLC